ncbi:hypothetical protein DBN17_15520 [Clostridioides difficile]|nr:hypothetical protein [Clostridioides difficile]OFU01876.1 hypothetical protein HMPREF3083_15450 [Clostridium sp. HMSC19D07]OFU33496.1 hypothetical protein HMPREF3075_05410 [Clostridium sp. HMSC19B11]EGT4698885.1 hypothetical protein [Clostridioides difficile]EGT4917108.1 hypothetical protein [Clostridioides difficile]
MRDIIVFLIRLCIYFLLAFAAQKLNKTYPFKKHIFIWICLILLISFFIEYINKFIVTFV